MKQITPQLAKKLGLAVEKMPAFPKSVQQILQLTRQLDCQPRQLVQVIEKDPVMTVKILKVLNSAYYSLPNKISSVNHSVVFLGFNSIKNLALSIALVGIFPRHNVVGFDTQHYLQHSLITAGIAKSLGSKLPDTDSMDCYIAGLLHDFGKLVFVQYMHNEFNQALLQSREGDISLHEAESQVIGVDHAIAGALLAEKWQFPKALVDCIRNHHAEDGDGCGIWASVYAANQICNKWFLGDSGDHCVEALPASVCQLLGGDIDAIIDSLGDTSKIIAEAHTFSQLGD